MRVVSYRVGNTLVPPPGEYRYSRGMSAEEADADMDDYREALAARKRFEMSAQERAQLREADRIAIEKRGRQMERMFNRGGMK